MCVGGITDGPVPDKRSVKGGNMSSYDGKAWVDAAIDRELSRIMGLAGDNPHKPDSEMWKSFCRLAGVVRGEGRPFVRPSDILAKIIRFAPQDCKWKLASREKDITYLWARAMNSTPPRFRSRVNT